MTREAVTVGRFCDLHEAYVVRSRLQAEGIQAWMENEQFTGLYHPGLAVGPGASLKVPAEEAARALEILREAALDVPDSAFEPECAASPTPDRGSRHGLRSLAFVAGMGALALLLLYLLRWRP